MAINTFHKVWIVPEKAVVHQSGDIAFVMEARLKVMLEEDYLARSSSLIVHGKNKNTRNPEPSAILRDLILPEIEREINEGENFAPLRQIYHSMILATWFKRNLKASVGARHAVPLRDFYSDEWSHSTALIVDYAGKGRAV